MSPKVGAFAGAGRGWMQRGFRPPGLAIDKARGLEVEDFNGGVVGFRLPEEGAGEAEAPKPVKATGRRKTAG